MAKVSKERKQAIQACLDVVEFVRKVQPDLARLDVIITVDNFWHTMGDKSMIDLNAYIVYARAHDMEDYQIAGTIGHDLNGAGSHCFLPRSDGYSERLADNTNENVLQHLPEVPTTDEQES